MTKILGLLNELVWGAPALVGILGVGLYLSLRLGFVQLTLFPKALRSFASRLVGKSSGEEGVSGFQALCTALAATVGTGNLVGVAGAICLGGPGAVFWMWICGILGMVTKFGEATLAVRYRKKTKDGFLGGPMYMITRGLGPKWKGLACAYCFFGVIASFGVGNATQVNAVVTGVNSVLTLAGREESRWGNFLMGVLLAALMGTLLLGGARRIGRAAERLVPFAASAYILLCLGLLAANWREIPDALGRILQGAFCPRAVTGGMLGSGFQALRTGCSRGVFTNEAGMGTASIAHGAAEVAHPVQQGLMGIMEVFLDTILICTLTALVILVSGVPIPYGVDAGAELTTLAFTSFYGEPAAVFLAVSLILFAVATVLGWGLYGARCAEYLLGPGVWKYYVLIQIGVIMLSTAADTAVLWQLSETVNGLMAIPNLIALAMLSPELHRLTKEYKKSGGFPAGGGNYADFHQCKPL